MTTGKEGNIRLVARLDIKGENVVKGVHFEGLRIVGLPGDLARKYSESGIDEILYIDSVASLYGRNSLRHIVEEALGEVNVPVTVGGGLRTLNDIREMLRAGADKVALNTEVIKNPALLSEASREFGSQCIVLSIAAKRRGESGYTVYTDNARENSGVDVFEWVKQGEQLGAGEILITSIDREGTMSGFDQELYRRVCELVRVPVIAGGGAGEVRHVVDLVTTCPISAVSLASVLHYEKSGVAEIKEAMAEANIPVRIAPPRKTALPPSRGAKQKILLVDFGVGNLFSVQRALQRHHVEGVVVTDPEKLGDADKVILPGVGTFPHAMDRLEESEMVPALREFAATGKPLLGICLGAQLLMTSGEEFESRAGLDLIPGDVVSLWRDAQGKIRVPHIGWSRLRPPQGVDGWGTSILADVPVGAEVYFVHSFRMTPEQPEHLKAICEYGEQNVAAVVQKDNVIGCQFHPERSGWIGWQIIRNFCEE